MAHSEGVPDTVLEVIKSQVRELLATDRALVTAGLIDADVVETFDVWELGADDVIHPATDLSQLATRTGLWHHQVIKDDLVGHFAQSMPLGPSPASWVVTEIFESPLAARIDDAIDWIDKNVTDGDPLVRLLVVPAYKVYCFWLIYSNARSQVYVIDCPTQFDFLRAKQLLEQDQFIVNLRKEQCPIGRTRS